MDAEHVVSGLGNVLITKQPDLRKAGPQCSGKRRFERLVDPVEAQPAAGLGLDALATRYPRGELEPERPRVLHDGVRRRRQRRRAHERHVRLRASGEAEAKPARPGSGRAKHDSRTIAAVTSRTPNFGAKTAPTPELRFRLTL